MWGGGDFGMEYLYCLDYFAHIPQFETPALSNDKFVWAI